jgi:hypothetical protein
MLLRGQPLGMPVQSRLPPRRPRRAVPDQQYGNARRVRPALTHHARRREFRHVRMHAHRRVIMQHMRLDRAQRRRHRVPHEPAFLHDERHDMHEA